MKGKIPFLVAMISEFLMIQAGFSYDWMGLGGWTFVYITNLAIWKLDNSKKLVEEKNPMECQSCHRIVEKLYEVEIGIIQPKLKLWYCKTCYDNRLKILNST